MIKKKTLIWIVVSVLAVALAFVVSRIFLYAAYPRLGGYLIPGVIIGLLAWKAFSRTDADEVRDLRKTVKDLDRQLAEKNATRINVTGINPILHIATMNVDTSFVRPYVREKDNLTFNGALRADVAVEYGIKMEEVKFRFDPQTNTLTLANFHPGIISYSRKQLKWEFAKAYKSREVLGHVLPDVSDSETAKFTQQMSESLRAELEAEIDGRSIKEFEWLSPVVTEQVTDVLRAMIGNSSVNISITEGPGDENYLPLKDFRKQLVEVREVDSRIALDDQSHEAGVRS